MFFDVAASPVAVAAAPARKVPKQLPPPNSDFYQFADVLTGEEKATVQKGAGVHGVQGGADQYGSVERLVASLAVRSSTAFPGNVSRFFRIIQNCFEELRCARIRESTYVG
jgi:hypothetical protein